MKYLVKLERVETYVAEIEYESDENAEGVLEELKSKIAVEGWDGVCKTDGEYDTCETDVVSITCLSKAPVGRKRVRVTCHFEMEVPEGVDLDTTHVHAVADLCHPDGDVITTANNEAADKVEEV